MDKEEIKQKLDQSLNSPTWNELKQSFIGRELIEYGTSVIFLSQQQVTSIQNNQYVDTADLQSLLMYCFNRDIPVNINRPAYIKASVETDNLLLPYSVTLTSGKVSFSNIGYVDGQEVTTFYQGTVNAMYTKVLANIQETETQRFTVYYDVDEGSYFIKLGKDAMFESVRAYTEKGSVQIISEYDILREDPDANVMKLKRGYDKSLNLYFGNGIWGAKYSSQYNYHIVWLNTTQSTFDATNITFNSTYGSLPFVIESSDAGLSDDISMTRENARAGIAKLSVAATEPQIRAVVNNCLPVLDCLVSPSQTEPNKVTIYVKPKVVTDTIFDSITDKLNLFGEIVTQYVVKRGEPINFYVYLKANSAIAQSTKNDIEQVIKDYLSYDVQPYKMNVSSITINDRIYSLALGKVIASIKLKQHLDIATNEIMLPTRPYRGTIEVYQGSNLVGWDTEGLLYGAFDPIQVNLTNLFKFGDFFISCGNQILSYNEDFSRAADSTGYAPFSGTKKVLYDANRALLKQDELIIEIDINDTFVDGLFSIQRNPTSRIVAVSETRSNLDLTYAMYQKDVGVYRIVPSGSQFYLFKYEFKNGLLQTPNFSVIVAPEAGWTIKALAVQSSSAYVFFSQGVRFIQNYTNPTNSEMLLVDNIQLLQDNLDNIVFVNMENILTVMVHQILNEKHRYILVRSSGFEVTGTTTKRMILKTEFQVQMDTTFDEEHDFIILSQSLSAIYLMDRTSSILYRIVSGVMTTVVQDGDYSQEIVKIGSASYSSNILSIEGRSINNVDIVYETSEPLNAFSDDMFPVMDSIVWE